MEIIIRELVYNSLVDSKLYWALGLVSHDFRAYLTYWLPKQKAARLFSKRVVECEGLDKYEYCVLPNGRRNGSAIKAAQALFDYIEDEFWLNGELIHSVSEFDVSEIKTVTFDNKHKTLSYSGKYVNGKYQAKIATVLLSGDYTWNIVTNNLIITEFSIGVGFSQCSLMERPCIHEHKYGYFVTIYKHGGELRNYYVPASVIYCKDLYNDITRGSTLDELEAKHQWLRIHK